MLREHNSEMASVAGRSATLIVAAGSLLGAEAVCSTARERREIGRAPVSAPTHEPVQTHSQCRKGLVTLH